MVGEKTDSVFEKLAGTIFGSAVLKRMNDTANGIADHSPSSLGSKGIRCHLPAPDSLRRSSARESIPKATRC